MYQISSNKEMTMSEHIYKKLAKVLELFPSGFPKTETGVGLEIL
jgi:hypothetical protein